MYLIYVLKSLKDQNLYVGCTSDISKRLEYHNQGRVSSTKNRRPFVLIYTEECINKYDAFKKEKYYKTPTGKRKLKNNMALSSSG